MPFFKLLKVDDFVTDNFGRQILFLSGAMVVCYGNVQTAHTAPLAKPVESHFLIFQSLKPSGLYFQACVVRSHNYWKTIEQKTIALIIQDEPFQKIWSLILLLGELMLIQFFTASTNNCHNVLEANISCMKVFFAPILSWKSFEQELSHTLQAKSNLAYSKCMNGENIPIQYSCDVQMFWFMFCSGHG